MRDKQIRSRKGEKMKNKTTVTFYGIVLCLSCILTLAACRKKADPIILPQIDDITDVDIIVGENTTNYIDKNWISEMLSDMSASEPTNMKSVQDVPGVESYIKIDFHYETGTSTIFAYEDRGNYYIEQPYQGIYKIDDKLFKRLKEGQSE